MYMKVSEEEKMSYLRDALAAAGKAIGDWDASGKDSKSTMRATLSAIAAAKLVEDEASKELWARARRDGLEHQMLDFNTQHIAASAMMAKALGLGAQCDLQNFHPYADISRWACGFAQACDLLRSASDLNDIKQEGYLGDHAIEYAQKLLDDELEIP